MTNCYKLVTNFGSKLEMQVILIYNIEVNVRVVGFPCDGHNKEEVT